jgi:hypothetical protein
MFKEISLSLILYVFVMKDIISWMDFANSHNKYRKINTLLNLSNIDRFITIYIIVKMDFIF